MDIETGGNDGVDDAVELRQVDSLFFQFDSQHAASNIDADEIRDNLILDRHGRTDHASGTGVTIRHNTDLRSGHAGLIEQIFDLRFR